MKVVINVCFGGFGISKAVYDVLGIPWDGYGYLGHTCLETDSDTYRSDPRLIAAIEKVGIEAASGDSAKLKIIDVPDDVEWCIHEYDGLESIHEKHREWS